MNTPTSAGNVALFSGFMLAMIVIGLAGMAWPAWGLWRWSGGWRIAAAVPAVVMAFVVLRILLGTFIDPTSHNLWPFEVVMWGALSCGAMLLLGLGASRTDSLPQGRPEQASQKKAGIAAGLLHVQQLGETASGQPEHALPWSAWKPWAFACPSVMYSPCLVVPYHLVPWQW